MQSIFKKILGLNSDESSSESAKNRLSLLLHSEVSNEDTRELKKRIFETVEKFYAEKGMLDKLDFEEIHHEMKEGGLLEVQIPLPEDR